MCTPKIAGGGKGKTSALPSIGEAAATPAQLSLPVWTKTGQERNPSRKDIHLKRVGKASYVGQTGPIGLYSVVAGEGLIGSGGYTRGTGLLGESLLLGPGGGRIGLV